MRPGIDGIETARRINEMTLNKIPRTVMVTAYGREEIFREAEKAGIEITLVKPVNPSILFDAAVWALGGDLKMSVTEENEMSFDERDLDFSHIQGARILLAEDNLLNQQVAMELLSGVASGWIWQRMGRTPWHW
jgi:two-component system sensor histidine kinase/response regulator